MTATTAPTFAIEEDDSVAGYKHVHRAGCRDLRDPERVGPAANLAELLEAVQGYEVADDLEQLRAALAPCVKMTR